MPEWVEMPGYDSEGWNLIDDDGYLIATIHRWKLTSAFRDHKWTVEVYPYKRVALLPASLSTEEAQAMALLFL